MRLISTDPQHPGIFAFGQFAVGVVAIGQIALGVVAIGQVARGIFCVGQAAIGVFCIGQGSIGLYHGTGMIALAGPRGYGLALHLLPQIQREPPPLLPTATPPADLLERRADRGWLYAKLQPGAPHARAVLEGTNAAVDTAALQSQLDAARTEGNDWVHLLVRAERETDKTNYRKAESHVRLIAEEALPYRSSPPVTFLYGAPPKGAPRFPVTLVSLTLRSFGYLAIVALVVFFSLMPLAKTVFGVGVGPSIFH